MKDGTRDLCRLLAAMEPRLLPDEFVFCSVADGREEAVADLPALATFREEEGLSLVLERSLAESHGFRYGPVMRCISLTVHSALDAVGLTAAYPIGWLGKASAPMSSPRTSTIMCSCRRRGRKRR